MYINEFPAYLSFGKLNSDSIRPDGFGLTADYELLDKKVMEVSIAPKRYRIKSVFKTGYDWLSHSSISLEHCLSQQLLNAPIGCEPAMDYLIDKVIRLGNIYFEFPIRDKSQKSYLFYPSGNLLLVRIPITAENINCLPQEESDLKGYINLYNTTMQIKYKNKNEPVVQDIAMLELLLPLALAYERLEDIVQKGIILRDKKYRAIVCECMPNMGRIIHTFMGTKDDDYVFYTLNYRPLGSTDIDYGRKTKF